MKSKFGGIHSVCGGQSCGCVYNGVNYEIQGKKVF